MKFHNFLISILIVFGLISCSEKEEKISLIKEDNLELQMIEAYEEGINELNRGDIFFAAKKFNEVELLYPQSVWAPRSILMAAYAYYTQLFFDDAIIELERFLDKYKNHPDTDYVYYFLAICHYNKIVDEKKDLGEMLKSKEYFNLLINEFPNTDYAEDAKFKMELIEEVLASKELYLANYYLEREKWIPAINRFKKVIKDYDRSIYAEEALHRLVEVHYRIGLLEESKKYAILLGYNYQSGEWYQNSYRVFNKNYEKISDKKKKNNNKSILKRISSILAKDNE